MPKQDYKSVRCLCDIHADGDIYVRINKGKKVGWYQYIGSLKIDEEKDCIGVVPNPGYLKAKKLRK